jgi:hypothetical protein
MSDAPENTLTVEDANGNALSSTTPAQTPVAIVYSTGANLTPDGENNTPEAVPPYKYQGGTVATDFDDIAIWITRPPLLSKMVAAGRLP